MGEELTEEQNAKFTEAFLLFVQGTHGKISSNELDSVMQVLDENPTDMELQYMVNEMDPLQSGYIHLHTFLEWMAKRAKREEDEIREAFRVFDKDGDGYICAAELHQVLESIGMNLSDEEVEAMIREADKDGDGKVSEEEFVEIMIQK